MNNGKGKISLKTYKTCIETFSLLLPLPLSPIPPPLPLLLLESRFLLLASKSEFISVVAIF